ncbi:MAG: type II toxin-antitoxin system RelB/DinJ family antitoxin [Clostridiales bacterium]|jgi:DNA-damage-inducible protein J|nr:type II toxin-antitoxin system RelB/DinJ family antitoxin [Clostridiales bacterium]
MPVTTFSIRIDSDVKRVFDQFCAAVGMNTTTAINMFVRSVVREQRLPFDITTRQAPFFSEANQKFLRESIAQLERGEGNTYHDAGEIISDRA